MGKVKILFSEEGVFMLIESVSILNFHEQLGLKDDEAGCFYGICISMTFTPDIWWKQSFQLAWIQQSEVMDRNILFFENELLLELERSDNIQMYIDSTKELITKVYDKLSIDEKKIHMMPRQKENSQNKMPHYALKGKVSLASYEI